MEAERLYADLKAEVQRRSESESPHAIAKDLGICRATAYEWVFNADKGPSRIYAEEPRNQARELMEEGLTDRQVCELTGVGKATLKKWRKLFGMTGRQLREHRYPRAHSPYFKRLVLDRVAAGETMRSLSQRTGITHETISRWWCASGRERH